MRTNTCSVKWGLRVSSYWTDAIPWERNGARCFHTLFTKVAQSSRGDVVGWNDPICRVNVLSYCLLDPLEKGNDTNLSVTRRYGYAVEVCLIGLSVRAVRYLSFNLSISSRCPASRDLAAAFWADSFAESRDALGTLWSISEILDANISHNIKGA